MKFRPRFTVRTLAIFVTLVCAYLGAWEVTKKYVDTVNNDLDSSFLFELGREDCVRLIGPGAFSGRLGVASSPAPLIVVRTYPRGCQYFLWLFGPKIKLPFESEWK